jgi:alanyl aminopeptidase
MIPRLSLLAVPACVLTLSACSGQPLSPAAPIPPSPEVLAMFCKQSPDPKFCGGFAGPPGSPSRVAAEAAQHPPALRLPRTVLPARYQVSLTVVPGKAPFQGAVDVDLQLTEPTSVLWLNATGLTVTEAHLDVVGVARPLRTVAGDDDFVGFALDEPAGAGAARLHVAYTGKISDKDDRGLFVEEEEGTPYVFSQFESIDARRAFPCFDEPSFKVPWQLTLHVREGDVALSNTAVLSETREAMGMKAVHFQETKPLPSYLVAFAVGPFDLVDAGKVGRKGTPVRLAVPHGQAAQARYAVATTPAIIAKLEELFDVPFPYDKLDMVAVPRLVTFGAMENAGLITFTRAGMLAKPEEETPQFEMRFSSTTTHELGHHWFGDLVTTAWWDDIWLNEAFASWVEAKILVPWHPEWRYDLARLRSTARAMASDALVSGRRIRQGIVAKDDIHNAFDDITYSKGSAVIGMFEAYVGPERFRKGVHRYLVERAHGNATATDFLAAISAEAGSDVAPAFSTFLDQPGVPLVSAELRCDASGAGIALSQQRYLPAGSSGGAPERWQIPVCVRWGLGKAEGRACTLLAAREATLPLPEAKGCPEWFVPNDGAAGYYHASYASDDVAALLRGAGKLSLPERVALIRDLRALVAGGHLSIADALARVPDLLRDPHPQVLRGVLDLVASLREPMIPEAERPRFAHFIGKTFGARARALGWTSKPHEDPQVRLLRPSLLTLVADRGGDQTLAAEADQLARRWLDDPRAVEADVIDAVLSVAAQRGDRAFFDRLRADAKKTKDDNRRRHLLGAMADFRDPAIVKEALGIVLGDEHDVRDTTGLLFEDVRMQDVTFGFVKQRFDALVARLPSDFVGNLPSVGEPFCDEGHRAEVESFFKDRAGKLLGGPRNLAKALERIRLCSTLREAQAGSLAGFLKKY